MAGYPEKGILGWNFGSGSFVIGGLQIPCFHRSNPFFTADFKSAGTGKFKIYLIFQHVLKLFPDFLACLKIKTYLCGDVLKRK